MSQYQDLVRKKNKYSQIIKEENRKPKSERNEKRLTDAKARNRTISRWLNDLEQI
jgi:hypothetical protein